MAIPREDIEFKTCDGTVLRGWLYPQAGKSPCVIMTHGLGGVRHYWLPAFADRFHKSGYAVLLYDNRNWGDSDGLPRQESNPPLQQADYYDAFNFASTLPCVDSSRIVYWGSSFSGEMFSVSGETRSLAFKDRIPILLEERARIAAGAEPERIPLIADSIEDAEEWKVNVMFPGVHAYKQMLGSFTSGGQWSNDITAQTQLHMLGFEGQAMIHRISPTPLLMVIPGNDILVTTASQLAAFGKAREPKEMLYLDEAGHFDIYTGEWFEKNIAKQLEFLKKYVPTT
ncbi:uncharacterized protein N7458_006961 [Penicillium daleae]|uniref:AB hydrolase-1 domain-containing protein n=1 Tax=Penicillium daleae TaxID=63821 RepID=A0AAD6C5A4_9EURO|nr:uncharacterized protein N7458_006961 [Penicillium daleae]KAJ5450512.1 hypothetical protein N7458_006961 [Penicillium daleae]